MNIPTTENETATEMSPLMQCDSKDCTRMEHAEEGKQEEGQFGPDTTSAKDLTGQVSNVPLKGKKSLTEEFWPNWNLSTWMKKIWKLFPIFAIVCNFVAEMVAPIGLFWEKGVACFIFIGIIKAFLVLEDTNVRVERNEDALKVVLHEVKGLKKEMVTKKDLKDLENNLMKFISEKFENAGTAENPPHVGDSNTGNDAEETAEHTTDGTANPTTRSGGSDDAADDPDATSDGDPTPATTASNDG